MKKTYNQAIECLNSLQSNAATIAQPKDRIQYTLNDMKLYLRCIGHSLNDLNKLNIIHVTGTKGKGSTCAFTSSILKSISPYAKIGLYTSPHLVAVRERIRINDKPISEENFTKYFFDVWNNLNKDDLKSEDDGFNLPSKPPYFRFMTLMAFHTFLCENVDTAIIEVGIGGTYDCTNLIPQPTVTAVSNLGLDHTALLGSTIGEIARNKGGIFKHQRPAISVNQPSEGLEVLNDCANKNETKLDIIDDDYMSSSINDIDLGLKGHHQKLNAKLAIKIVESFISNTINNNFSHFKSYLPFNEKLPSNVIDGLISAKWPGRCQTVSDINRKNVTWHLDGSHTDDSLKACVEWYTKQIKQDSKKILIFNCTNGRSAFGLLETIFKTLQIELKDKFNPLDFFNTFIFTTNVTYTSGNYASDLNNKMIDEKLLTDLKIQNDLKKALLTLLPSLNESRILIVPSIQQAINHVDNNLNDNKNELEILVCGSLHLIGGVIEVSKLSTVAL